MTKRLTTEQLEAIRKRAEAATEGPWEISNITDIFTGLGAMNNEGIAADQNDGWQIADCGSGVTFVERELESLSFDEAQANTQFISAARTDIPALLAEVERLQEEANNLERFSTDHLVYELMRRDEETGGDTE